MKAVTLSPVLPGEQKVELVGQRAWGTTAGNNKRPPDSKALVQKKMLAQLNEHGEGELVLT